MEEDGIILDYSRQKLTPEVKALLVKLAEKAQVKEKMVCSISFLSLVECHDDWSED